jgi:hypothetical protein
MRESSQPSTVGTAHSLACRRKFHASRISATRDPLTAGSRRLCPRVTRNINQRENYRGRETRQRITRCVAHGVINSGLNHVEVDVLGDGELLTTF